MSEFGVRVDDSTVRFERLLPGPIENVWPYLADSEKRGQWFTAGGLPQVGGAWEMRYRHASYSPHKSPPPPGLESADAEEKTMPSMLLALEPPHRIAFTFGNSIKAGEYSEVDIRLTPQADGKVKLTLTHTKLRDANHMRQVFIGWHAHLEMLQYRAEGKVPPSIWDVWRDVSGIYENVAA